MTCNPTPPPGIALYPTRRETPLDGPWITIFACGQLFGGDLDKSLEADHFVPACLHLCLQKI